MTRAAAQIAGSCEIHLLNFNACINPNGSRSKYIYFEYIYARGDPERLFLNGLYSTHRADRHFKVCIAILKAIEKHVCGSWEYVGYSRCRRCRPQHTIIFYTL